MTHRYRWLGAGAGVVLAGSLVATTPPAAAGLAEAAPKAVGMLAPAETALVRLGLPNRAAADRLVASGADVAAGPHTRDGVLTVDVVLTGAELAKHRAAGATLLRIVQRAGDGAERLRASQTAASSARAAADTLVVQQAYFFRTSGQLFLQPQVATTATDDEDVEITVTWRTADGRTGSFPLQRFEDADEYQFHFSEPQPVPARPVSLTATSSLGGSKTATPTNWPGVRPPALPKGYQKDFIDAYMTPTDIKARIARLGRQYPQLVDVVDLPHRTTGYQRTASGYLGVATTASVVVESVRPGSSGLNGVQVKAVPAPSRGGKLVVRYRDRVLTVQLARDASGAVVSTTAEVAAAINAAFPDVFRAFPRAGQEAAVLQPADPVRLSDGLGAPPEVSRGPWTVQALRIGRHRDGSRPGVLAYSQEHAREWATPLVTMEFAERLLANARTDAATADLLENTEVFVIPTVNPDGANYSFYDFNFQRKNLNDHCTGAQRDPANADRVGVDVNRNYAVGSIFDGYDGASLDCLSGVHAGTGELSEAESRNVVDFAAANPNIEYALNVHSYGGYFMWSPGAYKLDGRVTLPRPSIDEAKSFLDKGRRIVGAISRPRGTVTWPSKTGPVVDVLYSAAGNSADQLYYDLGITAWDFEVGNDRWNAAEQQWEPVGFQPPYQEAHGEAMEYAEGLVELVRIAREGTGSKAAASALTAQR